MTDFLGLEGMTRGRMLERAAFHLALFIASGWWFFAVLCVLAVVAAFTVRPNLQRVAS